MHREPPLPRARILTRSGVVLVFSLVMVRSIAPAQESLDAFAGVRADREVSTGPRRTLNYKHLDGGDVRVDLGWGAGMAAVFHGARVITNQDGRVLAIEAESLTHNGETRECDKPWVNPVGRGNMTGCGPLAKMLFEAYGLPHGISVGSEYTEVSDMERAEAPHIEWSIQRGQACKDSILDFLEKSGGLVEVETHGNGAIWVKPSAQQGPRESALDHVIDLEVTEVSTWEALKVAIEAVNAKPDGKVDIWPFPLFWLREKSPLPAFVEDKSITLILKSVTARQALCAIAATSPLTFRFSYECLDRTAAEQAAMVAPGSRIHSNLSLYMWDENGNEDSGVRMSPDEHEVWTAEIGALRSSP